MVIFATILLAHKQEDKLLLEQVIFFTQHRINEPENNFNEIKNIDFKGRNYVIIIFSPLKDVTTISNLPQDTLATTTNWQFYKQKADITLQTGQKLEAVRLLPEGYRLYVYFSSTQLYQKLATPLNVLPFIIFLIVLCGYIFYLNRQTKAWQSLLDYSQSLQYHIIHDYQPYAISQGLADLDMAQMAQTVNRFGFQLHTYFNQLKILSQHQEVLIENMPLPLLMLNRKGRITYFNQQFSRTFMTPFYAEAMYLLSDFVAGKDKANQQKLLNITLSTTTMMIEVTDLQHNQFFDLYLEPIYNHLGKIQGFSGCLQNITHYHAELQEAWLNEKQQQDKLASFDKLWAVLGHELRTPLTGMLGMIEILDEDKSALSNEQQEVVQTLQQSGQGMLQMLNDMLDIAKLGAGKLNTNIAKIDLLMLMRQVTELMVGNARRHHIDLIYHIDGKIPRYIETDDGRLRQILLNLLSNAIKFTKQGYVALLADLIDNTHPLIIQNNSSKNPAQKWLRIMVKDTGMGISEKEQKKLFSFFNQANESISRQFGGTGLGLAISNSFSQLLGGFIHLHSIVGEGSEFQVYLPLSEYRNQASFLFNTNNTPIHLILVLKYAVSKPYLETLFASLKLSFNIYIDINVDSITQINQQFDNAIKRNLTPIFIIDDHCYYEHTSIFEQNTFFQTSPKIFLTMNTEKSLPITILEKFDGILTKPITVDSFLAEANRVYDKFNQKNTLLTTPLSAQAAYEQFLKQLTPASQLSLTKPNSQPSIDIISTISPTSEKILVELTAPKKSILVAEDNPVNQKIVQRHLNKLGYEVILAGDGQQAIDLLHTHKTQIGLILMDCRLPILDGLEATRLIRAEHNSIPIIALTANNTEEDRQLCLSAGMDNFLTKPLNKDTLAQLLNRYMI